MKKNASTSTHAHGKSGSKPIHSYRYTHTGYYPATITMNGKSHLFPQAVIHYPEEIGFPDFFLEREIIVMLVYNM